MKLKRALDWIFYRAAAASLQWSGYSSFSAPSFIRIDTSDLSDFVGLDQRDQ